jgi:hypothetical protein
MARLAKKSEETANVERERMSSWIAAYHQNRDEFLKGAEQGTTGSAAASPNGQTPENMPPLDLQDDGEISE